MKWMIALLFCSITAFGFGQKYFQLKSTWGTHEIIVNGKNYSIDSNFQKIPTRYPGFDTLMFTYEKGDWGFPLICNFKPDSNYSLIGACCGTTDIVPSSKLNHDSLKVWSEDIEMNMDKIQRVLMDHPSVTFKIKNVTSKDSIYAWYQDHACFPSFKLIDQKGWDYGVPMKCFFWSNISPLTFFKSTADYSKDMNEWGTIEDVFPEDQEGYEHLGTIYVRLFDDEQFVVSYDGRSKEIKLSYNKR